MVARAWASTLPSAVTILQQFGDNPLQSGEARWHSATAERAFAERESYFASFAIRCASRETLRRAALRCTTFFCAARMMAGSAWAMAARAAGRSPAVIASSTLRTTPRKRERRDLLIAVRRVIWRAAFLADLVLAMIERAETC
jgi:hypothetical protein